MRIVGVLLDNDQWHWSGVSDRPSGKAVLMRHAVPAGRSIKDAAKVVVFTVTPISDLPK